MLEAGAPVPRGNHFRKRLIEAVREDGLTYDEAAERFTVGRGSVSRWVRRSRETGDVKPRRHPGLWHGTPDGAVLKVVKALVHEKPDRTGAELAELITSRTGRPTRRSAITRALEKLGQERKEKPMVATGSDPTRAKLLCRAALRLGSWLDPRRCVFTNKTATHIAMTRTHGRAPSGVAIHDRVPRPGAAAPTPPR